MNAYEVTFANGEVVIVAAWTPELAQAIAEEEADRFGCGQLCAVSVESADVSDWVDAPDAEPLSIDGF